MLLERHGAVGTETSSRNSEVIHAGVYYPRHSLKTRLCIRGKQLLYELCEKHAVPHRRTGKWIVAQTDAQRDALETLHAHCRDDVGVPTRWVASEEIRKDGEGVVAARGALESPTTGIVDAHGLMVCLQGLLEEAGGVVALTSPVEGVTSLGSQGWQVTVRDASSGETSTMTAECLINAAGLGAADVNNMIIGTDGDQSRHVKLYYAKGNYFSYGASQPKISRLIYPAPEPGAAGLGTHLTLDMGGRIRFGPDVEWVDSPDDLAVSSARLTQAVDAIRRYLPGVDETALAPDYAGIRPKLTMGGAGTAGKGFNDFVVRKEAGFETWVNLLGIESPGLTSSLAIAEMVEELLYGNVSR